MSAHASLGMLFAVLLFLGTYLLFALYPISFAVLARVHPNKKIKTERAKFPCGKPHEGSCLPRSWVQYIVRPPTIGIGERLAHGFVCCPMDHYCTGKSETMRECFLYHK